jgi:hypothetical protein
MAVHLRIGVGGGKEDTAGTGEQVPKCSCREKEGKSWGLARCLVHFAGSWLWGQLLQQMVNKASGQNWLTSFICRRKR